MIAVEEAGVATTDLMKLRDDPSLIKNAVEEILRFESPVVQTGRIPESSPR